MAQTLLPVLAIILLPIPPVTSIVRRSPAQRPTLANVEYHESSIPRRREDVAETSPCSHRGRREKFCADGLLHSSPLFNCTAAASVCPKEQRQHCDAEFLGDGIKLTRDEYCLNGPKRLVAEGFLSPHDCSQITRLFESQATTSHTKGQGNRALFGSRDVWSADTKWLTEALRNSPSARGVASLILTSSRKIRRYLEAYFALRSPLHFHTTRIECQVTSQTSSSEKDEHESSKAASCEPQPNGACLRRDSNTKWQNYSATLFLNDDSQGGHLVFTGKSGSKIRALVPSKCGRAVIAASDQPHGYMPVSKARGRHCRLVLGFTHAAYQRDRNRDALETAVSEARQRLRDRRRPGRQPSPTSSSAFFVRRLHKHAPMSQQCRIMIVLGGVAPILACYVCFFSCQFYNYLYPHRKLDFSRFFNYFTN